MKALYIAPGRFPEEIETNDAERTLGDRVDMLHPFLDENLCVAALLDRDDFPVNMTLLDEDLYELEEIRGAVLIYREDEEDLTEEDMDFIESHIRCYESSTPYEEEEEAIPDDDEEPEDGPDDESFSPTHIVDGFTFGEMLQNERTEEQKFLSKNGCN